MKIKYVGPFAEVEVDRLGAVKRGTVVEAPNDLAGREPVGSPDDEDYDPGVGLLAQSDNWQSAKPAAKTKED